MYSVYAWNVMHDTDDDGEFKQDYDTYLQGRFTRLQDAVDLVARLEREPVTEHPLVELWSDEPRDLLITAVNRECRDPLGLMAYAK